VARLYADEEFSYPVVEELRQLENDVLTAQEAGQANQGVTDSGVLAFATARDRAVVTFNRRHFINLRRRVSGHRGILVCTRDPDVPGLARRIHRAILGCSTLENQLLRINRPLNP
jgi:hypothetical protein